MLCKTVNAAEADWKRQPVWYSVLGSHCKHPALIQERTHSHVIRPPDHSQQRVMVLKIIWPDIPEVLSRILTRKYNLHTK